MKRYYPDAGLGKLCRLFGKTRQGFHDKRNRSSNKVFEQALILDKVRQMRLCAPTVKTGGVKIHLMLKEPLAAHNVSIGRDRFLDLLRTEGLLLKIKKRYARTTDSNHPYPKFADLTRFLQLTGPGQLWVSDITYLRTENGFLYLSVITDAYSRKIVGYHLSHNLKASGCLIALDKAVASRGTQTRRLIHHSDRGIQYCCQEYVFRLQQHCIQVSMTQSGSPYENAMAERVNGILKSELGLEKTFRSYNEAVGATHQAIDFYNRLRPHMSLGYLVPEQVHGGQQPRKQAWKNKEKTYKPY